MRKANGRIITVVLNAHKTNNMALKESTLEKYKLVVDEWFINGWLGNKAYQSQYPDANDNVASVEFHKIIRIPKISEYKKSKRFELQERLGLTLESQMKSLLDISKKAIASEKYGDAINAIKEQNKVLGHYEEDNAQQNPLGDLESGKIEFSRKSRPK